MEDHAWTQIHEVSVEAVLWASASYNVPVKYISGSHPYLKVPPSRLQDYWNLLDTTSSPLHLFWLSRRDVGEQHHVRQWKIFFFFFGKSWKTWTGILTFADFSVSVEARGAHASVRASGVEAFGVFSTVRGFNALVVICSEKTCYNSCIFFFRTKTHQQSSPPHSMSRQMSIRPCSQCCL